MPTVYINDYVVIRDNYYRPPVYKPTHYIYDAVHISDNWDKDVTSFIFAINDTVVIKDNWSKYLNDDGVRSINDGITISDNWDFSILDFGAFGINDGVTISDNWSRNKIDANTVEIEDVVYISDAWERKVFFSRLVNQNITFGETKKTSYREYSNRFRWTNYNGQAVPDLNYKDLKEPISRIIPAPSFLQFKYDNSFLLFTRNSINRFILDSDTTTGQWRAQTDNLIEEFSDFGLMAPKTLVLAADTLFGLSEKGVWKWNKDGMSLISDKIIDLPDAGDYEYIAFYCPIRNQYILHRQESSGNIYIMTYGAPVDYAGLISGVSNEAQIKYIGFDKTVTVGWKTTGTTGLEAWAMVGIINRTAKSVIHGAQVSLKPAGGGGGRSQPSVCELDTDKVVLGVDDQTVVPAGGWRVYVGTIVDDVLTLGAAATIAKPAGFSTIFRLEKLNTATFVAFYGTDNAGTGLYYRIGTVDGTTITLGAEKSVFTGTFAEPLHTAIVSTNKIAILYRKLGSNSFVAVATYGGGETLTFGTHQTLGGSYQVLALSCPIESRLFMAYGAGTALLMCPAAIDGVEVTLGSESSYAGYLQIAYPYIGIANHGANGFYIFFTDLANSNRGTAVYGAGSELAMQLYEETKTVFCSVTNVANTAASLQGGLVICNNAQTGTYDGFEQIWGMEYAAINSFVYQINKDQWYKFLGIDILDVPVILSGGSLDENYNLWLDSDRELQKYPGTITTTIDAYIRTKEFYIQEGVFQRWLVDFEGSGVDVETRVIKEVGGSEVEEIDTKFSVAPNKFRGLPLGKMRGRTMSIKIINAEIIKALSLDVKGWGER